MKIAMLTSDYLPNIGGIASHIYELSRALIGAGHEVEVWLWDRKGVALRNEQIVDVPVRVIAGKFPRGVGFRSVKLARQIEPLCRVFLPDLIHVHTLDPLMAAIVPLKRRFPVKAVWTNHTSRYLRRMKSPLWRYKMRYYIRGFDGLLATSRERLEKSLCLGLPRHACNYIPNGVDPDKFPVFSKHQARVALNIRQESFVLLYTGRFAPIKGTIYLANALLALREKIPNLLCVMCGNIDGDRESDKFRTFIAANKLVSLVRMEGFIPNDRLGPYLYACDALVLPSLMEATSISALEAMAAGRPVIGSRVGGIPELITEGETGFLANPGDSRDLARAIESFWKADNKSVQGSCARQKIIDGFTWRKVADSTVKFYQAIMQ